MSEISTSSYKNEGRNDESEHLSCLVVDVAFFVVISWVKKDSDK